MKTDRNRKASLMDGIDKELYLREYAAFEEKHNLPPITKYEDDEHLFYAKKGRFTFLAVVFDELIEVYRNCTHANYWCQIDRQFIAGHFAKDRDPKPMPGPQDANSLGALAITWENFQRFSYAVSTENGPEFDFQGHLLDILGVAVDDAGWNMFEYESCRDYWTEAMYEIEGIEDAGERIKARFDFLKKTKEEVASEANSQQ